MAPAGGLYDILTVTRVPAPSFGSNRTMPALAMADPGSLYHAIILLGMSSVTTAFHFTEKPAGPATVHCERPFPSSRTSRTLVMKCGKLWRLFQNSKTRSMGASMLIVL